MPAYNTIRDVRFGRIWLPTVKGDIKEAVGDSLEAVGAGVTPGERRPRTIGLTLPLHGNQNEFDPFEAGHRMRRQVRALMENGPARLQGVFLNWSKDPEQNGWLLVGTGDVEEDDGALVLASWTLTLGDIYRVAKPHTHRPSRRLELYDRRLSTTPRDYLGNIFSTDFASTTALSIHALPVGARDIVGYGMRIVTPGYRESLGGQVPIVVNGTPGETIIFLQDQEYIHGADDVVAYDRRGNAGQPTSFVAQVLVSAPLAYYRLGEPLNSTVAKDSARGKRNGEYVNFPQLGLDGPVPNATAAQLDNTHYVRTADHALWSRITTDLSIAAWIKPVAGGAGIEGIAGKAASVDGSRAWRLGHDRATDELVLELSMNGTAVVTLRSGDLDLPVDQWSLVGVSYKASTGTATFYKNGQPVGTATGGPPSIATSTRYVTIGKWESD